jgi:hypothetical protein
MTRLRQVPSPNLLAIYARRPAAPRCRSAGRRDQLGPGAALLVEITIDPLRTRRHVMVGAGIAVVLGGAATVGCDPESIRSRTAAGSAQRTAHPSPCAPARRARRAHAERRRGRSLGWCVRPGQDLVPAPSVTPMIGLHQGRRRLRMVEAVPRRLARHRSVPLDQDRRRDPRHKMRRFRPSDPAGLRRPELMLRTADPVD